jgi:dynein heavy chain
LPCHTRYQTPASLAAGFFDVDFGGLVKELLARAEGAVSRLVARLLADARAACTDVCAQYDGIAALARTVPTSTDHLVQLKAQVEDARKLAAPRLAAEVGRVRARVDFLLEAATVPPEDAALAARCLTWPPRLEPVFEEHAVLIRTAQEQAMDSLRARRAAYEASLGGLQAGIAALEGHADVARNAEYLAAAAGMTAELEAGVAAIDGFNAEEEAFEWEPTSYPLRHKLAAALEPYALLYKTIAQFAAQHEQWLHGPMAEINPEAVENTTGNMWRNLYKLQKTFAETPAPCKMAAAVKTQVDEFKQQLPLIQSLCNPGLRPRHWVALSGIVGLELGVFVF